jgi:hypothetical protein
VQEFAHQIFPFWLMHTLRNQDRIQPYNASEEPMATGTESPVGAPFMVQDRKRLLASASRNSSRQAGKCR